MYSPTSYQFYTVYTQCAATLFVHTTRQPNKNQPDLRSHNLFMFYSKIKWVEHTHLAIGADIFICVLIDKDVDPRPDHGSLQGGDSQPLPCDVRESFFLLRL